MDPAAQTTTGESFHILALLEAMSERYHEHHAAIMAWSWRLFCAKWCRLIDYAAGEEVKRLNQEIQGTYDMLRQRLDGRHDG